MARLIPRNCSLPPEVDDALREFCRRTVRNEPDVIRAALKLFLADGYDVANARLLSELWDVSETSESAAPHPDSGGTKVDAEYIVTGRPSKPERSQKKGA